MNYITYREYIKTEQNIQKMSQLNDIREEYKLEGVESIDKKHDKLFRNLFKYKREVAYFINQFMNLENEINKDELIQCNTSYVTNRYKDRQADIVYKLKNTQIYFLIEHQSKVDYEMTYRIFEYVKEIMDNSKIDKKVGKNLIYPIVVPIVLYTGINKWTAKRNFAYMQSKIKQYEEYLIHMKYNLVDINELTFDELQNNKTLVSNAMIIEKCKTKEELINQIDIMIKNINDEKEKQTLLEIIINIVEPIVGKEETKKMVEKLNKSEVIEMSPVQKMLYDLKINAQKKGMKKGMEKGIEKNIIDTTKNMLMCGETEEKIIKYTKISKDKIDEIKKELSLV